MLPKRNNVATELTWNLTTIFENDEAWQRAFDNAAQAGDRAANGKVS
jgi:oligoendopeptidase F